MPRAMATRRRMPPESSDGNKSSVCPSSTNRSASLTRFSISSGGIPPCSLSGYATLSRTVSESKRALSWKTMPTWRRMSKRSRSLMLLTSWPSTKMRPLSGHSSPRASFRMSVLPVPATPRMTFVSPRLRVNETSSSTLFSSNAMLTCSNATAILSPSAAKDSGREVRFVESLMRLSQCDHEEPRDEQIGGNNQDRCCDHRLGRRAAYTLGSARGRHAVIATDRSDEEAEHDRLAQSHHYILKDQRLIGSRPVLIRIEPEEQPRHDEATGQSAQVGDDAKEEQHNHRRDHARRHEFLRRVGAESAHRVNLLGHFHGTVLAGHAAGVPSGDHQARQNRAKFAHHR